MSLFDRQGMMRAVVGGLVCAAGVLGAMRLANAIPGGETRPSLSFAGTLTGTQGAQMLTFAFKRGSTTVCSPQVSVTPGPTGAFSVVIPLMGCPTGLFDGGDVNYDVSVGSTVLARDQAVTPVPYARYADRVGTPDCPVGYERDGSASGIVLCRKPLAGGAFDEVVRVGTGASAFWIDRYEASVWQGADGGGLQYGAGSDNYPTTFLDNGQTRPSNYVYAFSRSGVSASASITWFQAQVACRASGKRLPNGEEWLAAAAGTEDPGESNGANGSCLTTGAYREAGRGTSCASVWGAQDMVGNLSEWTAEWFASPPASNSLPITFWSNYNGGQYSADRVVGVSSFANPGNGSLVAGMPAAARRGDGPNGTGSGVFALNIAAGPSLSSPGDGFRCVIPR